MPDTKKIVTVDNLDRFKNKLPSWVGTRAEHTAAEAAGTLPTNGIIGISDEEGSGGGGGGGDARSKIFKNVTVYKSSDFDRISDGTYARPCVHFQGKSSGKIVMIKLIGESTASSAVGLMLGTQFNNIKHSGGNLSDGILYNTSGQVASSWNVNGITVTKLPEGGISISGTSNVDFAIRIGTLTTVPAVAGTVRCYGLTGNYDGLKLAVARTSYDRSYYNNTACPLDEEADWATLLGTATSSQSVLSLMVPANKTFDCTFYPMISSKWIENDHYERPFDVHSLGFLNYAVPSYYAVAAATTSTIIAKFPPDYGRSWYRYSVDYPVVHTGENIFINNANNSPVDFEIYYTEDEIEQTDLGGYISDFDSEYEYAYDYILNPKFMLPFITGSYTPSPSDSYVDVSPLRKQNSVLPTKIYYGCSVLNKDQYEGYKLQRRDGDSYSYINKILTADKYIFNSASYGETLRLPYGSSFSNTCYYGVVCDYSGFDDSTTIT